MTPVFHLSNKINVILAHYGPPSTETPTTETTTVQCYKNSWIYLTSTYYWWLIPTITIRFDSKFQIIAQRFEMKKHYSHSTSLKCLKWSHLRNWLLQIIKIYWYEQTVAQVFLCIRMSVSFITDENLFREVAPSYTQNDCVYMLRSLLKKRSVRSSSCTRSTFS